MNGLDLFDTLNRELPLNIVRDRKVPRAAEAGLPLANSNVRFWPIVEVQTSRTSVRCAARLCENALNSAANRL